jgi:hypothetical protein
MHSIEERMKALRFFRRTRRNLLFLSVSLVAPVALALSEVPARAEFIDSFTLENGQRVRATDHSGQRGKRNPDGSVTYADGTTISVGPDGSTVITSPDGSTRSQPPPDSFELPNGQRVRATDPSGQRGKQYPDGSVVYPDGTRVAMDGNGDTVVNRGDGVTNVYDAPEKSPGAADGATRSSPQGSLTLPNGDVVPARGADGMPGVLQPDGSIAYGAGTVISGPAGTKTRITHPDGRTEDYVGPWGPSVPDPLDPFSTSGRRTASRPASSGDRRFQSGSRFTPNPVEDVGEFRFDLRLDQFVDSSRAKGKFTQYVNTADGTVAVFNPDQTILNLGGQPLPNVTIHFLLMRPGGTWLVCGRHKDFGNACAKTGGAISTATGQVTQLHAMQGWFESLGRVAQTPPATTPATQPDAAARAMRGKFPGGQTLTLWRSPNPSGITTHIPWLGFGAGLYKDYPASQNRIAQVVAVEGSDFNGGNLLFKLLNYAPETRTFSTSGYRQVTAFSSKGLSEATSTGQQLMQEIPVKMAEIERALQSCPKGSAGSLCRERYRAERKALEQEVRDQIRNWSERHGLPFALP